MRPEWESPLSPQRLKSRIFNERKSNWENREHGEKTCQNWGKAKSGGLMREGRMGEKQGNIDKSKRKNGLTTRERGIRKNSGS